MWLFLIYTVTALILLLSCCSYKYNFFSWILEIYFLKYFQNIIHIIVEFLFEKTYKTMCECEFPYSFIVLIVNFLTYKDNLCLKEEKTGCPWQIKKAPVQ